jgi:glycosyltransferase involved in cell wall biosynthesis
MGYVGIEDLPDLIRKAFALIILSRYETFGIPAIEAMAVGTPVVAARHAALPEVVGEAGLLVEASHAAGVVQAVMSLFDGYIRERYRRLGFRRAEHFRWENCMTRLISAMKGLANHG